MMRGNRTENCAFLNRLLPPAALNSGWEIKTMSLPEGVCPMLAARTPTDPNAARLLEMFRKADEELLELSPWIATAAAAHPLESM
jgi:hypothetical protein